MGVRGAPTPSHFRKELLCVLGGVRHSQRNPNKPCSEAKKRVSRKDYSAAAGSTVFVRAGNSNSTFPSSFKTSRARKGLPLRERKPERTSRVFPSSISWRAISGVSV